MYNQCTKRGKEVQRSAHAVFDVYGVENCKIELIEEFPCSNKMESHKREGDCMKISVYKQGLKVEPTRNTEMIRNGRRKDIEGMKQGKKKQKKHMK